MSYIKQIVMFSNKKEQYAVIRREFYDIMYIEVVNNEGSSIIYGNSYYKGKVFLRDCNIKIDMSYGDNLTKALNGVDGCDSDLLRVFRADLFLPDYLAFVGKHSLDAEKSPSTLEYINDFIFYSKTIGYYNSYYIEDLYTTPNCKLDGDYLYLYGHDFIITYKIINKVKFSKVVTLKRY